MWSARRLIENNTHNPSPADNPLLPGKATNTRIFCTLAAGALFVVLISLSLRPLLAHAGPFSFSFLGVHSADAFSLSKNSQTMSLLSPAVNIDPNPAKGGGNITVVDGTALEAQAGPSGTVADIEEWPTSSQISVYTVRSGDTLSQIATMYGVSVNTIIWANDIERGIIRPGETLVILPITGIRHTVVKGETLSSIAKKFKSDAREIAQYNGLEEESALAVGTTVIIPHGELAAPAPSRTRSTAVHTSPYLGGSGPAIDDYYLWPVAGGVLTQSLHGWNAVDIGASKNTLVYASAPGVVIISRSNGAWNGGYGNYVVVRHGNGTQTLYAHLSGTLVSAGQSVSQGQAIGLVGSTGESTGNHLHFEVRGAKNPFTR